MIQGIGFGPFGTLWVARRGASKTGGPMDVCDETEDYLGTFATSPMDGAAIVGDDRIAAIVTDELDVERLTLLRAIRNP